ncbi:hypothetical protein FPOA_12987 [Fusarium poae]|uniref:Uncharacterized protein n=1 Tax=Fusarium poae TaxID=36050 RepID=A0A1B8A792_FUSPO|nr:hypothetical protein FPOA_12993 [Fusarium poae]OBS16353.1 hypothetical protein FPOA_12987 [Fusarium poae]
MKEYLSSLLKFSLPSPDPATIQLLLIFISVLPVASSVIALGLFRFKQPSDNDGAEKSAPASSWGVQAMGYLLSLTPQPENFLRRLTQQLQGAPAYIPSIGREIYLAMPGKQIEGLFRRSSSLVPTPSLLDALSIFFGLSGHDVKAFSHGHISAYESNIGVYTTDADAFRCFMKHQRQDCADHLEGRNLVPVVERFKKNLASEISATTEIGQNWGVVPDLFTFLPNPILTANIEALYGEHRLKTCPNFLRDFWAFYKAFPNIAKGLPRWMMPSSFQTRDEMLKSFSRWRTWYAANFDWNNHELRDVEYEPIWGTQYVRKMVQRHEALGLSDNGVTVVMLGYFFITMATTVPAAVWMIIHILLDEDVLRRVWYQIGPAFQSTGAGERPDIKMLMKDPLLNSIYYETLRLRVTSTVGRTSIDEGLNLAGGWNVKAGEPIMCTGRLAGLDESFWNTGQPLSTDQPSHPLETFWAERFLDCPGSTSLSGPMKKKHVQPIRDSPGRPQTQVGLEHARSKASVAGSRGHFFPFGGGSFRCPGEALAKQVIFASVAILLQNYDFTLIDPEGARKLQPSHQELPFGLHSFDGFVPVEIRRL